MTKRPIVRTSTAATVTLTIELTNLGSWGPDCMIDQVYRQAVKRLSVELTERSKTTSEASEYLAQWL